MHNLYHLRGSRCRPISQAACRAALPSSRPTEHQAASSSSSSNTPRRRAQPGCHDAASEASSRTCAAAQRIADAWLLQGATAAPRSCRSCVGLGRHTPGQASTAQAAYCVLHAAAV